MATVGGVDVRPLITGPDDGEHTSLDVGAPALRIPTCRRFCAEGSAQGKLMRTVSDRRSMASCSWS